VELTGASRAREGVLRSHIRVCGEHIDAEEKNRLAAMATKHMEAAREGSASGAGASMYMMSWCELLKPSGLAGLARMPLGSARGFLRSAKQDAGAVTRALGGAEGNDEEGSVEQQGSTDENGTMLVDVEAATVVGSAIVREGDL
jgi:hypothetical protein